MDSSQLTQFISDLIEIPSPSGEEQAVLLFLESALKSKRWGDQNWVVERIPVTETRWNLFVSFGRPRICMSTHVDIVDAPPELFLPRIQDGKLFGRGACDAKGIVGCMVAATEALLSDGAIDLALLFVVGEEHDGIGAIRSAEALKGRGIRYLINGEPTEGKLMLGHKGGITIRVEYRGRSCHSGYPHLGDDANAKLIRFMNKALDLDLGEDPVMGKATLNLGRIQAGTGDNIVSDYARVGIQVRTVFPNQLAIDKIRDLAGPEAEVSVLNDARPVRLKSVPGMETDVAAYCTDIPHFDPLHAECLLYGPGTIRVAHTNEEFVSIEDLMLAVDGYKHLYWALTKDLTH